MLKALFKKQLLEISGVFFRDRKTGTRKRGNAAVLTGILFAFLFLMISFSFGTILLAMVDLLSTEYAWLFFSIAGILALLFGVVGSVFNTYAGLYRAKDNDFLLSMPILPSRIILVRIAGVALIGCVFSSIIMIPALILFFLFGHANAFTVFASVVVLLLLYLLVTILSCLLGWIVALGSGLFKNRKWVSVALYILIFVAYMYIVSQSQELLLALVTNADQVGNALHMWVYPLYQMGMAATGDTISLLCFTAEVLALAAVTWFALTRTFSSIATRTGTQSKTVYKEKTARKASLLPALIRKERTRFTGSTTYMFNAGLGIVLLPIAGIALLVKSGDLRTVLDALTTEIGISVESFSILLVPAICMICSMNMITAPSVSLEGSTLWLLQSMPVPTEKVLTAKQAFHCILAVPPALFLTFCFCGVMGFPVFIWILLGLISASFTLLIAAIGLAANLRSPNLHWTNETIPIKQSPAVFFAMFGGWLLSVLLGVAGWFLMNAIGLYPALAIILLLILGVTALLEFWIYRRGTRIFASLS